MRARLGVGVDFLSDWAVPADLWAYSWLAALATMSNVAEAQTSTRMDRFIAPSEIQLPKLVHSTRPRRRQSLDLLRMQPSLHLLRSKEVRCIPVHSDSCFVEGVHY